MNIIKIQINDLYSDWLLYCRNDSSVRCMVKHDTWLKENKNKPAIY